MLTLNPSSVTLFGRALEGVVSVAVERRALRLVAEQSDKGPHCVLADVPEQRVTILIVRALRESESWSPRPGDQGALSFRAAPAASDAGARTMAASVVLTESVFELPGEPGRKSAVQRLSLLAISADGAADPISEMEDGK